MHILTKSQKARTSVRTIKTTIDALALRGYYKPSGKSGQTLSRALKLLSPEIYGSMNDPRIIELKGLEYVIERLPLKIENCSRIVLTAREDLENTSFETVIPPKRRRLSYRISDSEMCFVITRGLSEIYDVLTHVTFLNIEAGKIFRQMKDLAGNYSREWSLLAGIIDSDKKLNGESLDKALWNLSVILGRTLQETRETCAALEKYAKKDYCNVLFQIIFGLGRRVEEEIQAKDNELIISFTPALQEMIGNQSYCKIWAKSVKEKLLELGFENRPVHIISANLHSVLNLVYGYDAVLNKEKRIKVAGDIYDFITRVSGDADTVKRFAGKKGFHEFKDLSGSNIDCQIIDTARAANFQFHPDLKINLSDEASAPLLLVMDYAFGTQAFEALDELLEPLVNDSETVRFGIKSISIMGKAGTLTGDKGDIMLATSHVFEGTSDNYIVNNDITEDDFDANVNVFSGPIVTVVGTSLQNQDLLKRFQASNWKAVGLEMEGGHYQKAIGSAIIRGHLPADVKTRYAYYASDNPLLSGQTLASGSMGQDGIKPTYMITKIILEKICS